MNDRGHIRHLYKTQYQKKKYVIDGTFKQFANYFILVRASFLIKLVTSKYKLN